MPTIVNKIYRGVTVACWVGLISLPVALAFDPHINNFKVVAMDLWRFSVAGITIALTQYAFPNIWNWIKTGKIE